MAYALSVIALLLQEHDTADSYRHADFDAHSLQYKMPVCYITHAACMYR